MENVERLLCANTSSTLQVFPVVAVVLPIPDVLWLIKLVCNVRKDAFSSAVVCGVANGEAECVGSAEGVIIGGGGGWIVGVIVSEEGISNCTAFSFTFFFTTFAHVDSEDKMWALGLRWMDVMVDGIAGLRGGRCEWFNT